VEQAATRRDEHEQEGAEQLREEPAPLELRIVPLLTGAELERQPVANALRRFVGGIGAVGGRLTNRVDDSRTITLESEAIQDLSWASLVG
jgi:hypothetical protein